MAKLSATYLVRVHIAKVLIDYAMKHYGLTLADFDMPPHLPNYQLKLMPLKDLETLLCKIERLTQDPTYTAKLSQSDSFKQFGPFVQLLTSSTNLGMAIKRMNTVHNALQSGVQVNMLLSGSIAKWRILTPTLIPQARIHESILAAGSFVRLLRLFHGKDYQPISIHLTGTPIGNKGEIEAIFSCPITWNSPNTQVWFPVKDITCPKRFTLPTPQIKAFTIEQAMSYMLIPLPQDILKIVFELTKYSLFFGYPTLEFVASKMGMKPLTLQRRLQDQSISFTDIVHHSICDEAISYMNSSLSMNDIAQRVGYKNTASFSVAFKRIYGMIPIQYRNTLITPNKNI
ncbi:AraC family transcriptional regulator ligand-binding domain-containing protein [Aliivibrio salmonicida]|uniref:AraC family transcriptional regulator ligand-binding domain-containing protein n=1 Tax=Aliivibrio salmonicida TaxID=40269 RepID=UPI00406CDDAE